MTNPAAAHRLSVERREMSGHFARSGLRASNPVQPGPIEPFSWRPPLELRLMKKLRNLRHNIAHAWRYVVDTGPAISWVKEDLAGKLYSPPCQGGDYVR